MLSAATSWCNELTWLSNCAAHRPFWFESPRSKFKPSNELDSELILTEDVTDLCRSTRSRTDANDFPLQIRNCICLSMRMGYGTQVERWINIYRCNNLPCRGLDAACNGDRMVLFAGEAFAICLGSASDWFSSSSLIDGNTNDGPISDSAYSTLQRQKNAWGKKWSQSILRINYTQ